MNNLNDKLGLQGKYRTIVHRAATGKTETSEWKDNTINQDLKEKVNDVLLVNSDFALDRLFEDSATPPPMTDDGIMIHKSTATAAWYAMIGSSSEPTTTSTKITGTFTGVAGTFSNAKLGGNVDDPAGFNYPYATPTNWDDVTLAEADTLTVEWTITVGA